MLAIFGNTWKACRSYELLSGEIMPEPDRTASEHGVEHVFASHEAIELRKQCGKVNETQMWSKCGWRQVKAVVDRIPRLPISVTVKRSLRKHGWNNVPRSGVSIVWRSVTVKT